MGSKSALFVMHPEKTPGSHNFTALFYQKLWDIIKDDLIRMVNEFLFYEIVVNGFNDANICLLQKKRNWTSCHNSDRITCPSSICDLVCCRPLRIKSDSNRTLLTTHHSQFHPYRISPNIKILEIPPWHFQSPNIHSSKQIRITFITVASLARILLK